MSQTATYTHQIKCHTTHPTSYSMISWYIMISQTKLFPSLFFPQQHIDNISPSNESYLTIASQGDIILSEFKAVMLASLRSLVPKESRNVQRNVQRRATTCNDVQRGGWRFPLSHGAPPKSWMGFCDIWNMPERKFWWFLKGRYPHDFGNLHVFFIGEVVTEIM